MQIKLFEVRDRGTFIPAIAIKLGSYGCEESWLLYRVGFGLTQADQEEYILFGRLNDLKLEYDFKADTRTMPIAHQYIKENWDKLLTGAVIDVEFILGETEKKKESERFD